MASSETPPDGEAKSLAKSLLVSYECVERTLRRVHSVHSFVPCDNLKVYHKSGGCGSYALCENQIAFDAESEYSEFILLHELGHYLDYRLLSSIRFKAASTSPDSKLDRLIKILRSTATYSDLGRRKYPPPRYYRSAVELWARAYTQFIVSKTTSPNSKELLSLNAYKTHWSEDEFKPALIEIEAVFKKLKWM